MRIYPIKSNCSYYYYCSYYLVPQIFRSPSAQGRNSRSPPPRAPIPSSRIWKTGSWENSERCTFNDFNGRWLNDMTLLFLKLRNQGDVYFNYGCIPRTWEGQWYVGFTAATTLLRVRCTVLTASVLLFEFWLYWWSLGTCHLLQILMRSTQTQDTLETMTRWTCARSDCGWWRCHNVCFAGLMSKSNVFLRLQTFSPCIIHVLCCDVDKNIYSTFFWAGLCVF